MFSEIGTDYELKMNKLRNLTFTFYIMVMAAGFILAFVYGIDNSGRETVIRWGNIIGVLVITGVLELQVHFLAAFVELMWQIKRSTDHTQQILKLLEEKKETEQTSQPVKPVDAARSAIPPKPVSPVIPQRAEKEGYVFCPNCGEQQPAGRNVCWSCGVKFT